MPLTIEPLTTRDGLDRASAALGNCLDTYSLAHTRGKNRIVLIRLDGVPLYAVELRNRRLVQFKGRNNRDPEPEHVLTVRGLLADADLLHSQDWVRVPARGPVAPAPTPRARRARRPAAGAQPPVAPPRPPPPPRPDPFVSVQSMAADLIGPEHPDRLDWSQLAAALWVAGILAELPDPAADPEVAVLVHDLAPLVAAGNDGVLGPVTIPSLDDVRAARVRLDAPLREATGGWQRRRMIEVLDAHLRRTGAGQPAT